MPLPDDGQGGYFYRGRLRHECRSERCHLPRACFREINRSRLDDGPARHRGCRGPRAPTTRSAGRVASPPHRFGPGDSRPLAVGKIARPRRVEHRPARVVTRADAPRSRRAMGAIPGDRAALPLHQLTIIISTPIPSSTAPCGKSSVPVSTVGSASVVRASLRRTRRLPSPAPTGELFQARRRRLSPWRATDTLWGLDRVFRMRSREVGAAIAALPGGFHEFLFHPRTRSCPDTQCLLEL